MNVEAKKWAKEHRDGNKWKIWQVSIIVGLISGVATGFVDGIFGNTIENPNAIAEFLSAAIEIAMIPLTIGIVVYVVNIIKGRTAEIGQVFNKYSDFLRIFVTDLLQGIFILLYTLLLIIPGIIKAIAYILTNYILADDDFKDLSAKEILDLSEQIMDGHKMEFFKLYLYYFFMSILAVFTLGILYIWLVPEMTLATAKFATDLLENYKKENKPVKNESKKEKKEEK